MERNFLDIRTEDKTTFHTSVYHLSEDHESVKALFFMPLIPQTTEMCPAYSSQFSSSY